jgi:UDP-N-acetylmuramoyl-tripeptide--D-alanyl-D-alanine ligase
MGAALDVFGSVTAPGRKVLVLGDMLELGEQSAILHAGLASVVRASGADRVHLVGAGMAALATALPDALVASHSHTAAEAEDVIVSDLAYGDALMIKGSNGVGLARIVNAVIARFGQS